MLEGLKEAVCEANLELVRKGLVLLTWGNASAIDRAQGLVVIKPSGVPYETMRPEDMAVVDLEGRVVDGARKPSVDTATHLVLYHAWPDIGGVVHTHSHYATCWAQAGRPIPCFGTTHADFAYGEVPVADPLTNEEVAEEYERHIGEVIVRRFNAIESAHFPAVLAANHGPFAWGKTVERAVENACILEELARMALDTLALAPNRPPIPQYLLDKHFLRKHGPGAYYGQR
ncbi:MAG: L-ribulose-5-phosphate 4-epimerase AraD [Candidatus Hydrogenedentes bacterium]|nr:L-ribulose-5-phosphate 4-epimerase AraD [Candidatus Hydrogenedentota bacterium]